MKLTSNQANKMIKKLQEEKEYILSREKASSTYIEAHDCEPIIPQYCYAETARGIDEIDEKIAKLKHAININNCSTYLQNVGMTIDQALVRMAQLSQRKQTLDEMRKRIPKKRKENQYGAAANIVEYICTNYDIEKVHADYSRISDEIIAIQADIDYCNQTKQFEFEW